MQDVVSGGFDRWVERGFAPFLARALEWRYSAIACGAASLIVTGALVAGGWLRFTFQEPVDGDVIIADLTMEPGTPAHVTAAAIRTIEEAARRVQREADAQRDLAHGSIFTHILASVGEQPFRDFQSRLPSGGSSAGSGGHLGELQVEMIAAGVRDIAKAIYNRYWWSDCERGEGQYTFTKASLGGDFWKSIEYGLEWAANNGAMYTLGNIMTSWDGQGTIFYDGGWSVYPQYLHNLMQAETTTKDWKYANGGIWVPNWNSPSYLARWKTLQDTAKRFIENWKYTPSSGPWAGRQVLGKNILEYVDLRGFGNYGEWHTWPWGDDGSEPAYAKATDSTFKKLIDIGADVWGDYPLHIPVGAFDDNPWGEGTAFTAWYVLTRQTRYGVIGWRRDNIGDVGIDEITLRNGFTGPGGWKADTAIVNRWKYAVITGDHRTEAFLLEEIQGHFHRASNNH